VHLPEDQQGHYQGVKAPAGFSIMDSHEMRGKHAVCRVSPAKDVGFQECRPGLIDQEYLGAKSFDAEIPENPLYPELELSFRVGTALALS
jgi:hypothetical protein